MSVEELIDHIAMISIAEVDKKRAWWTAKEDEFLRLNLPRLGYEGVADALGRTKTGVIVHIKRRQLPGLLRRPDYLTAGDAAKLLGVDQKAILKLARRGILPAEFPRGGARDAGFVLIKRISLRVWAINPRNWIYFRASRVRDPQLRRLIELRRARWNDEWITVGQAALLLGLKNHGAIEARIIRGRYRAVRWGNYHLLRSQVLADPIRPGRGSAQGFAWSPRADVYLVHAREQLGLTFREIGRRMKWSERRAAYRYSQLRKLAGG